MKRVIFLLILLTSCSSYKYSGSTIEYKQSIGENITVYHYINPAGQRLKFFDKDIYSLGDTVDTYNLISYPIK